jgi:2-polyprenyl-3-methyl-5-hydroxy-6-metoxy-1,4-benzoquinol methylase
MDKWVEYFENTNRNLFDQCLRNRRLIELVIQDTPTNGRVLEVGCGTALLSLILADRGFEVTALDISKEVVDYAQKRSCLNKIKLKFVQGDSFNLSSLFEDRFFDTVCHSGVMEHFSDADIVRGLSEQRRVSKKVIFSVPNGRVKSAPNLFGDERFLDQEKWMGLIKKAGFNKVKMFGGYDLPRYVYFILPGVFFNQRFSFWWKYFSKHSIFVCE